MIKVFSFLFLLFRFQLIYISYDIIIYKIYTIVKLNHYRKITIFTTNGYNNQIGQIDIIMVKT